MRKNPHYAEEFSSTVKPSRQLQSELQRVAFDSFCPGESMVLFLLAFGTYAVSKLCSRMFFDIKFEIVPESVVIANLSAPGAYGDHAYQYLIFRKCVLELRNEIAFSIF